MSQTVVTVSGKVWSVELVVGSVLWTEHCAERTVGNLEMTIRRLRKTVRPGK